MKNLDIIRLTKTDLVRGIIRLTNTTNNLLKSCGNNLEHGCLAESTLRTKAGFSIGAGFSEEQVMAQFNIIRTNNSEKNITRVRTNNDIQHSMTQDIDRIILPYINGVAMGEFE